MTIRLEVLVGGLYREYARTSNSLFASFLNIAGHISSCPFLSFRKPLCACFFRGVDWVLSAHAEACHFIIQLNSTTNGSWRTWTRQRRKKNITMTMTSGNLMFSDACHSQHRQLSVVCSFFFQSNKPFYSVKLLCFAIGRPLCLYRMLHHQRHNGLSHQCQILTSPTLWLCCVG